MQSPGVTLSKMMIIKITPEQLLNKGARLDCPGLNVFLNIYGKGGFEGEWTQEVQANVLKSDLRPWLHWGVSNGLLPQWSIDGGDFSYADLSNTLILGLMVQNSGYAEADMSCSSYMLSKFFNCRFYKTQMKGSRFSHTVFEGSPLASANMSWGVFNMVSWLRVSFIGTQMDRAIVTSSAMDHCGFSGADLALSEFKNTRFSNCTFEDVKFDKTIFVGCTFYGCSFTDKLPKLYNCVFSGCRFVTVQSDAEWNYTKFVDCEIKGRAFGSQRDRDQRIGYADTEPGKGDGYYVDKDILELRKREGVRTDESK